MINLVEINESTHKLYSSLTGSPWPKPAQIINIKNAFLYHTKIKRHKHYSNFLYNFQCAKVSHTCGLTGAWKETEGRQSKQTLLVTLRSPEFISNGDNILAQTPT